MPKLITEFASTLQYHINLNSKLFKNNKLKKEVRDRTLKLAYLFAADCNIDQRIILDVYLVGGNANFNYTDSSDIDIHILIDFKKINSGDIDLSDYFKAKKDLWSTNHSVTLYGYDTELYIQNITEPHPSGQGIYSILHQRWIVQPEKVQINYDDPKLISKVEKYIEAIDNLSSIHDARKLKDKFKKMRTVGIQRSGEFSIENLVFKELRNLGYIKKLDDKYKFIRDSKLTLK